MPETERGQSREERILEHYERRLRAWAEVCVEEHDRIEANEEFMSYSKAQWPEADRARNEERQQPSLAINQIISVVNLLSGREMTSRLQPKPFPRSLAVTEFADVLEEGMRAMRDDSEAEHEDSAGFRPQVAHGYGWIRHRWDELEAEEGTPYGHDATPVYQVIWDPFCRKGNLVDRKGQMHGAWIGVDELADDMGLSQESIDQLQEAGTVEAGAAPGHWSWSMVSDGYYYNPEERRVFVVRYEWREREVVYTVARVDLEAARVLAESEIAGEIPPEQAQQQREALLQQTTETKMDAETFRLYGRDYQEVFGVPLAKGEDYARGREWRYLFAYIVGSNVMEWGHIPVGRFTYEAVTGIPVVTRELTRYIGIVDLMKDGQEWRNRMLLLALQMAAASIKGGLLVEKGMGLRIDEMENRMARPGFALELPPGTLRDGRIELVQPQPALSQGVQALLGFAEEAALTPTGLNKATLGQIPDPRRVSPTVVTSLQQAASLSVAQLVDAQRRFRKRSGRLTAAHLLRYYDEESLEELVGTDVLYREVPVADPATGQPAVGPDGQPQIQLQLRIPPREEWPAAFKFRIKVDESPAGPTSGLEFWDAMFTNGLINQVLGDGFSGPLTWGTVVRLLPSNWLSPDQRDALERDFQQQFDMRMQAMQAPPEGEPPPEEA